MKYLLQEASNHLYRDLTGSASAESAGPTGDRPVSFALPCTCFLYLPPEVGEAALALPSGKPWHCRVTQKMATHTRLPAPQVLFPLRVLSFSQRMRTTPMHLPIFHQNPGLTPCAAVVSITASLLKADKMLWLPPLCTFNLKWVSPSLHPASHLGPREEGEANAHPKTGCTRSPFQRGKAWEIWPFSPTWMS